MDEKKKSGAMQVVLFSLSKEEFAFNIGRINEIIRVQPYTKIPAAEDYVEGMINFRGRIISVVDLNVKLGFPKKEDTDDTRIIVVELDNEDMVGFRVDSVSEVLRVQEGEIRPAPSVITDRVDSSYIKGIVIMGERLVIVLNATKILSAQETNALAKGLEGHETEIKQSVPKPTADKVTKEDQAKSHPETSGEKQAEDGESSGPEPPADKVTKEDQAKDHPETSGEKQAEDGESSGPEPPADKVTKEDQAKDHPETSGEKQAKDGQSSGPEPQHKVEENRSVESKSSVEGERSPLGLTRKLPDLDEPKKKENEEVLHIGKGASLPKLDEKDYFWFNDGQSAKDVAELKEKLKSMDDKTFSEHVNESKNDFASWIRHVMKDDALADKIRGLRKKEEILQAL